MTPPSDLGEWSATLAKGRWAASRHGGQPWRLVPPHCQKKPERFDEFLSQGRNVHCSDYGSDEVCCNDRCRLFAWEHAFQMALNLSIKMLLEGGGGRAATMPVNGREMTITNLVQDVDNNNVNKGLVVNEEVSPSNQATASITA